MRMPRSPFRPPESYTTHKQSFHQRWDKKMPEYWKLALRLIYLTFAAFIGVVAVIVRIGEGEEPETLGALGWGGLITLIVAMVGSVVAAGLLMLPSDRIPMTQPWWRALWFLVLVIAVVGLALVGVDLTTSR